MSKPLYDYISSKSRSELPDELPLVHTSRCEWVSNSASTPELQPRRCSVYNEDLLYLFYGRPAYRIRAESVHEIGYCPICFILKCNRSSLELKRVMPIDSGGVESGHFLPHINPAQRELLELDASIAAARKVVDVLYLNNHYYLYGVCEPLDKFSDAPDDLVNRYIRLLNDKDVSRADDRRSAIEFQVTTRVSLKEDLLAVILPEALLDQSDLRNTILREWTALPITYPTFNATSPSEYTPVIRDRVAMFYKSCSFV